MSLIWNYGVKSADGETGSDAKAFYEFKDRLMDHYWESVSMVKGGLNGMKSMPAMGTGAMPPPLPSL